MNVIEWVKDTLKDGVELWNDEKIIINAQGVAIKRDTKRLREICLGVISSNNAEEWYRICRLNAPVGTVVEAYESWPEEWVELFNDVTALVRNDLTKCLLKERAAKSAQTLLNILQKRDKEHWADKPVDKQMKVESSAPVNLTFSVVE